MASTCLVSGNRSANPTIGEVADAAVTPERWRLVVATHQAAYAAFDVLASAEADIASGPDGNEIRTAYDAACDHEYATLQVLEETRAPTLGAAIEKIATLTANGRHWEDWSEHVLADLRHLDAFEPSSDSSIAAPTSPDFPIAIALVRWANAVRRYANDPRDGESPEWTALVSEAGDRLQELLAIPAQTLEGMAVKTYAALRYEFGESDQGALTIDWDSGACVAGRLPDLAEDALRHSPLLKGIVGSMTVDRPENAG